MPGRAERCLRLLDALLGEGRQQGSRGERAPGIGAERRADRPAGREPQHRLGVDHERQARGLGQLVQAGRQAALGRVVQRPRAEIGRQQRRLDDADAGVPDRLPRPLQEIGRQHAEPLPGLVGQHRGPFDRRRTDLQHDVASGHAGGADEPPVLAKAQHLPDHDRLRHRGRDLGVAADQGHVQTRERGMHVGEQRLDRVRAGAGRQQHDGLEPAWPHARHRDVVGVDHDRVAADLLGRQRDRVGRGDQGAAADRDRAGILADRRRQQHLGRRLPAHLQQPPQQGRGKLARRKLRQASAPSARTSTPPAARPRTRSRRRRATG